VVSWLCWNRLYSSCDYYFSWRGRLRVINKFLSVVLFSSSGVLMALHTFFIYFGVNPLVEIQRRHARVLLNELP
jgi:hypothetical protein